LGLARLPDVSLNELLREASNLVRPLCDWLGDGAAILRAAGGSPTTP